MLEQAFDFLAELIREEAGERAFVLQVQDHLFGDPSGVGRILRAGVVRQRKMRFSADRRFGNPPEIAAAAAEFDGLSAFRTAHLPFVQVFCRTVHAEIVFGFGPFSAEGADGRAEQVKSFLYQPVRASAPLIQFCHFLLTPFLLCTILLYFVKRKWIFCLKIFANLLTIR